MSTAVQDRLSTFFLAADFAGDAFNQADPPRGQSFMEELHLTAEEYAAVREHIRKLRGGTITQAELARVEEIEREKEELFVSFWRRLVAGVEVEPGPYTIEADRERMGDEPVPGTCDGICEYEITVNFPK